jgi:hypothetical protein
MKNLKKNKLIGKRIYVHGWQYDNSGTLLDGVITEIVEAKDKFGRLAFTLKTIDAERTLYWRIIKELIDNGFYKSNKFLNSGTNATILP